MSEGLARVASSVASNPTAATSLDAGENGQRALFDLLRDVRLGRGGTTDVAITIYDSQGGARAWAGRPSALPQGRISGASDFFVTPSPLGLRLVYVQPILASRTRRVGSVAAENILSPTPAAPSMAPAEFTLSNPIAPVSLRTRYEGAGDNVADGAFLLRAPDGDAVAEAAVPPGAVRRARDAWRAMVHAQALAAGGITLLLLIGPLLDRRTAAREARRFVTRHAPRLSAARRRRPRTLGVLRPRRRHAVVHAGEPDARRCERRRHWRHYGRHASRVCGCD